LILFQLEKVLKNETVDIEQGFWN